MNKPGYTTSEFWSTIITQILALIALVKPNLVVHSNQQGLVQSFAMLASALAAGLYSHSRAAVKVGSVSAVVAVPDTAISMHNVPLIERNS